MHTEAPGETASGRRCAPILFGPHCEHLSSARFRAIERREVRRTLRTGTLVAVISMIAACISAAIAVDESAAVPVFAINAVCLVASLGLRWALVRRLRRYAIPLGLGWALMIAGNVVAAGLVTPREAAISAVLMPSVSLMLALFIAWPTTTQLVASMVLTACSIFIAWTFFQSGNGLSEGTTLVSIITGVVSLLGHILVRRNRLESYVRYLKIRELNIQAAVHQHELARANEGLTRVARRDSLTGLGNRLDLNEELARANAEVGQGSTVGVVLLDIDRFKLYNDTNGHLAGDGVLRAIGGAILESIRLGDAAFRFGGEEFVVLTRDLELDDVEQIGRRILERIEALQIAHPSNQPWGVITTSAGVAVARITMPDSLADALQRADEALFAAKRAGRNRLVVAAPASEAPQPNVMVRVAS